MALNDYNARIINEPKKELTESEITAIVRKGCLDAFSEFVKTGNLPYACSPIYDCLRTSFDIKWNEDERKSIETESLVLYKSKLAEKNVLFEQSSKDHKHGLLTQKKRTALKYYFNKLKQSNASISFENK